MIAPALQTLLTSRQSGTLYIVGYDTSAVYITTVTPVIGHTTSHQVRPINTEVCCVEKAYILQLYNSRKLLVSISI